MIGADIAASVYHRIKSEGMINDLQVKAADALIGLGRESTANEIGVAAGIKQRNSYAPRIRELEKLGVIEKIGFRKCGVTGYCGATFWFTGKDPSKCTPEYTTASIVNFLDSASVGLGQWVAWVDVNTERISISEVDHNELDTVAECSRHYGIGQVASEAIENLMRRMGK
jgi:hypothetical protein